MTEIKLDTYADKLAAFLKNGGPISEWFRVRAFTFKQKREIIGRVITRHSRDEFEPEQAARISREFA